MGGNPVQCWGYTVIIVAICMAIILTVVGAYCYDMNRFPKMKGKLQTKKSKSYDARVNVRNVIPSHSYTAWVLGIGGNLIRTSDGIPFGNDVNDADTCPTGMHGNEMYVMIPTDVDESLKAFSTSAPEKFSKDGRASQNRSQPCLIHVIHSHDKRWIMSKRRIVWWIVETLGLITLGCFLIN